MRKIARRFFLMIFAAALSVALGMLIPRPIFSAAEAEGTDTTRRILVLTNPIHTDIAVSIDAFIREKFGFLEHAGVPAGHSDARWLIFGWGGRAFYLETPTWSELKPLPVLKALTLDRSVMHVDVAGDIAEPHPAVTGFDVSEAEFVRLIDFIADSFERGEGGPIVIAGAEYSSDDRFFEAKGYFNAFLGCNTWTARALREAGLRTGWWNPLPVTLAASLRLHN
ncbi:TIGR02117 family protein [Mesorhizobium sp. WSM2239]|uniref:TIGR02117 family protein n=2 Tax=unclassified Mesorhizobium TaxID=325217 RepID=A0AAU8D734_9HYPH